MKKTTGAVYEEWRNSLLKGFTTADLNISSKGSLYYLGLCEDTVTPILVSRLAGGELFYVWYEYYSDLLRKAPENTVPQFTHFYCVESLDQENWSAVEFDMVRIVNSAFMKPSQNSMTYAKLPVPTLKDILELCLSASQKKNETM